MCQIVLEQLQASPPYVSGNQPSRVTVQARATGDCRRARVTLRVAAGAAVIATQSVTVVHGPSAVLPLTGLITATFALPSVGLQCGDPLFVEVVCLDDAACAARGMLAIHCKPDPGGDGPGGGGDGPGGGGDGPGGGWPAARCLVSAVAATTMLLAALSLIAYGVGTSNAGPVALGTGLLAPAGVAWALWRTWCQPSRCVRLGVLCWVFKRGFLLAIPVIPLSTNVAIILVLIAYGSVAGILVQELRRRGCSVPSARLQLSQLPI
jgi:hypothetical protein